MFNICRGYKIDLVVEVGVNLMSTKTNKSYEQSQM